MSIHGSPDEWDPAVIAKIQGVFVEVAPWSLVEMFAVLWIASGLCADIDGTDPAAALAVQLVHRCGGDIKQARRVLEAAYAAADPAFSPGKGVPS